MKIKSLLALLVLAPVIAMGADNPNDPEHLRTTRTMIDSSGKVIDTFKPGQPASPQFVGSCAHVPCPKGMKDQPSEGCWECRAGVMR